MEEEKSSESATDNIVPSDLKYGIQDAEIDHQTQFTQNEFEKEFISSQPLVSDRILTSELRNEYSKDDDIYQNKVLELMKKYKYMRRTRGDGNCFYRAFGFGYLERNLNNKNELERFRQLTHHVNSQLIKLGYYQFTIEDLQDIVVEIIDNISNHGNEQCLMNSLTSCPNSDYLVAYLRLITSCYLQMNHEFFESFIDDGKTIKQFCSMEVEPMSHESDNIHVIALTKATAISLRVIYMDRSQQSSLTVHDFSSADKAIDETFEPMITMLYRPGHYDLLYEN